VGVDGSEPSKIALSWALWQAEMSGARLLVVTAWAVPALIYGSVVPDDVDWRHQAEAVQSQAIEQTVADRRQLAINTLIEQGHPALVLVDEARYADLLVVGKRGHGAFPGMPLGSVSEYCVTHAWCPVVVVPTPPTTKTGSPAESDVTTTPVSDTRGRR
jgi:nucleotide-binding universal stress UspA family protein